MTTLHQFAYSHFNEKARWALDYKGVPHARTNYLPGPHMPAIKKLTGQTQTPVLEDRGQYLAGSDVIIEHLEQLHPTPPLYPSDSTDRERALALQSEMDRELGPAVRTTIFSVLINELGYLTRMFGGTKSATIRTLYRASLPLVRGVIAKGNGADDPANIARCKQVTHTWLDRFVTERRGNSYLVGSSFSIADLTAASLLGPIASVAHPDMRRPEPIPESVAELVGQFAEHPTMEWVREIYAKHR